MNLHDLHERTIRLETDMEHAKAHLDDHCEQIRTIDQRLTGLLAKVGLLATLGAIIGSGIVTFVVGMLLKHGQN